MPDFDRSADDVGNVLSVEHLNLRVPDPEIAALFYVSALGFTRDPYLDFGNRNMWINLGEQQFHLPTGEAQRFRGEIGIVVPDLADLNRRLERIAEPLAGTCFEWTTHDQHTGIVCPWGNHFIARGPTPAMTIGLPYLNMHVAPGSAAGIGRFYREIMGCPATTAGGCTQVVAGHNQRLIFTETDATPARYDGHHIAVYLARFSGPHAQLNARGLVVEESDAHQYRFQAIIDPDSGTVLAELEHEVRSMAHPMYRRPLVNRNPANGIFNYRKDNEVIFPA